MLFKIIVLFSLFIIFFAFFILADLPSPAKLNSIDTSAQSTQILDRKGRLLYKIYAEQNRTNIALKDLPLSVRQAVIAIEDKDFYKHHGFNPVGGALRAVKEILLNRKLQGGSTITQQLVKTSLLTPERTLRRKIKEVLLAFWTERLYTKDQILEMYLNAVPYGGTAWGIESASQTYFGKPAKELNLAQSALLAGLPAAPTYYSPFGSHPEYSRKRQLEVLRRMREDGYISEKEEAGTKEEKLLFRSSQNTIKAPHFVLFIKDQLVSEYGERTVEAGGLKVTTTLDLDLQEFVQATISAEIDKIAKLDVGNGAALIARPPTGEILAMVGSKDYFSSESGNFNVTTALRQPGSAIKPINYAIGIENKIVTPATMFIDSPTCFGVPNQANYCPVNYDGKFHGPVQLRFALGNSYNIPAVKMLKLNGLETMVASASAFGITTYKNPDNYGLSLTLGGGEVRMLELSEAFGVFANMGVRKPLTGIIKIEDAGGKILKELKDSNFKEDLAGLSAPSQILISGPRVISPETAFLISHILLDNNARSAAFGPGSALFIPGHAVSVKTGTTDDKKDNWTIGYTPNFLVAVWVGNNDNRPMNPLLTSGVTGAAPVFNTVMKKLLSDQSDLWPKTPEGVVGRHVCAVSGQAPVFEGDKPREDSCVGGRTRFEYFIAGTEPKNGENNLKQAVWIDKTTNSPARAGQTENVEAQEKSVLKDQTGALYCLDCDHSRDAPQFIK